MNQDGHSRELVSGVPLREWNRPIVKQAGETITRLTVIIGLMLGALSPASADLRSAPVWYDQNAVSVTPDWHYRVPIIVPAGTFPNATLKVDVDFAALLAQMGVAGTFDVNSPRIVRSSGVLATRQEYTDRVYAGATDSAGNSRGEIRFLLEDSAGSGTVTYYLYFDISQNGTKPANPQAPINGNFEVGASGTSAPLGWIAPTVTAGADAQMRPSESVAVTAAPAAVDGVQTRNTDGTPQSGAFSYLIGNRSGAGSVAGNPIITFYRDIVVPSSGAGTITFRYRPEGWDSDNFDPIRIDLATTANVTLVEMVGPTAGNYQTKPSAPNTNNAVATNTNSGYRHYNGFDCDLLGGHRLVPPMTVACRSEPWFTVTQSLAPYAGTTVRFRVRVAADAEDKSWFHLDDVEWSVANGTLGIPQAFGVNLTSPATGAALTPGQVIAVTAQVDANPVSATDPVTAGLYDSAGTLLAGGFILYNDGSHGDAMAGDATWSNTGSIPAQPAPTVPLSAPTGSDYILRVFARDAAGGGLAQIPGAGAPQTQANFWNIDEITFSVQRAAIALAKTSTIVEDPVNGTTNPKAIPGATIQYCMLVTNGGPLTASTIVLTDPIPSSVTFQAGTMKSGTSCTTATTAEDDDNVGADDSDTVGASFASGTVTTTSSSIASGSTLALTFEAKVN